MTVVIAALRRLSWAERKLREHEDARYRSVEARHPRALRARRRSGGVELAEVPDIAQPVVRAPASSRPFRISVLGEFTPEHAAGDAEDDAGLRQYSRVRHLIEPDVEESHRLPQSASSVQPVRARKPACKIG